MWGGRQRLFAHIEGPLKEISTKQPWHVQGVLGNVFATMVSDVEAGIIKPETVTPKTIEKLGQTIMDQGPYDPELVARILEMIKGKSVVVRPGLNSSVFTGILPVKIRDHRVMSDPFVNGADMIVLSRPRV